MSRSWMIGIGVAVIALGIVIYSATYTVHQTQQALVLQFGEPVRAVPEPGLHFKTPFVQRVEYYDKRILSLDPEPQEVLLVDQKRINVDSFARFRIVNPLEFRKKARNLLNFRNVFGGRLNSAVRSEVAKVSLADMLSEERAKVMARITGEMSEQAPDFGVEVVDVRIGRTDLPQATSQAVYNRMRSERVAQAAQLRAEGEEQKAKIQAEADRDRTIIIADANRRAQILRGQGDATRTNVLNEAYGRDPSFFDFYRSLEAYGALQGENTTMVLSPDAEFFRYFFSERGRTPTGAGTDAAGAASPGAPPAGEPVDEPQAAVTPSPGDGAQDTGAPGSTTADTAASADAATPAASSVDSQPVAAAAEGASPRTPEAAGATATD